MLLEVVGMALVLISIFCGICFVARVCITVSSRPGAEQFPVPLGQQFFVAIYECAFTHGCSFTTCVVLSSSSAL